MWDPLETTRNYHNDYGHPSCQGGELPVGALTHYITWPFDHEILRDYATNQNHYSSTTRVAMVAKLCKMVICLDGLLLMKSHGLFIIWSCKITWYTNTVILLYHSACRHHTLILLYYSTTVPVVIKLVRVVTYLEGFQTINFQSAFILRSCKVTKQKKIILCHYQGTSGHQTWQGYNLLWCAPTYKVKRPFDHVVLRDRVTN